MKKKGAYFIKVGVVIAAACFLLYGNTEPYCVWGKEGERKPSQEEEWNGGTGQEEKGNGKTSQEEEWNGGTGQPESSEEITVLSEPVYQKEEISMPETEKRDESGNSYQLLSWNVETGTEPARTEQVSETAVFYGLTGQNQIQEVKQMYCLDERTGQTVMVEGRKTDVRLLEEWWTEEIQIPLICYLCSDPESTGLEEAIVYNANRPPEEACREILEKNGISREDYKIDAVFWEGDVFESSDGYLCRMVRAEGKRKVQDYQVTYEGTAVYPDVQTYRCRAVYRLEKEETGESVEEERLQEATEKLQGETKGLQEEAERRMGEAERPHGQDQGRDRDQESVSGKILHFIRETTGISVSLGAVLAVFVVAAVWKLFRFRDKRKKK